MKNKIKLFISIFIIIQFIFSIKSIAIESNTSQSYEDVKKALQEVAYSYYMRGTNIQYNSAKVCLVNPRFSPEEATSQNTNYLVCSGLTRNVYEELIGITIPKWTASLITYGKNYKGNPEVVAYAGNDTENNNTFTLFWYDKNVEGNIVKDTTPTLEEIIPNLKIGDVLTYTGHTLLVYDLIYDNEGNVVDAWLMESGHGNSNFHVKSKIYMGITIDGKEYGNGSGNYRLYHNSRESIYENEIIEGSVHITKLSTYKNWNKISTDSRLEEYSILRFIQEDAEGNAVLKYKGKDWGDNNHDNEIIKLPKQSKDRLKYSKLYIEKTVDKHTDDVVETGDELTYTITVKNNSTEIYTDDITVTENISNYVTYKKYEVNKENVSVNEDLGNKRVEWNIGKLQSGEEVKINYTVVVNEYCYGKTIESIGKVGNIPSSIVKNTISNNLTEQQANKIQEKYNELKNEYIGKELINEIYKGALGVDLKFNEFDITNLIKNNKTTVYTAESIALNEEDNFYRAVLNKYWNTLNKRAYTYKIKGDIVEYHSKSWGPYLTRRADTIYSENFETGDILIYKNEDDNAYSYNKTKDEIVKTPVTYENGEYAYIYIEGRGFVGVNLGNDGVAGTQDDRNEFNVKYYSDNGLSVYSNTSETDEEFLNFANYQTLFGKDYYVILRPSLAVDIVPMELNIDYSNTNPTNQGIMVTITSNEEMWKVEGWTLSEDKKTLTKTFNKNTNEELKVYDYGGNEKIVNIKIENIDKEKPILDVNYSTTKATNKDVIVTINSNEEIKSVSGWTLSENKKILTKTYTENKSENIKLTDLAGNTSTAVIDIKNIDKEKPVVEVKYSTTEKTLEDVIVTIEANEELQEVEGWQLSDDKKILTKTYTKNGEENITIYDLAGNSIGEAIKVENIDKEKPEYEVKYSTTLSTNEDVTVTITANEEIQSVEGWTLSEDKKVLTKTYTENTEEEIIVKDILGNSASETTIKINNIDKIKPEINISYSITEITNQDIIVTIIANEEIKEIEGWNLSTDKKELKKEFTSNTEENITISDLAGNAISDTIKISNVDKVAPKIEIKYSTTSATDKDVIVTITSDKIIRNIDGWTLSSDKKQLTKTFTENGEEEITITDEAGNSVTTNIKVSNIDKTEAKQIDTKSISNNDTTTSKMVLPNTGEKSILIFIVIFMILSTIMYIKFKKYKDVK